MPPRPARRRRPRALSPRSVAGRPHERNHDRRAGEQQARQHVERGLEPVVESRGARGRDRRVGVGVVPRRGRRDRADRRDPEGAADLTARVDQARGDARVGALHTGEAADRDRDERQAHARTAEHEGREEIPEVVPVHGQPREPRDRRSGREQPESERRTHAEAADDRLRDIGDHDHRQREGDEGDAALDGRVMEDALQVEREHEELRKGDRADNRHRGVRARQRAQPEDAQREERRLRAELDHYERGEQGCCPAEEPERRRRGPAVAGGARRRVHEQHQPGRHRSGAGNIEVPVRQLGTALT